MNKVQTLHAHPATMVALLVFTLVYPAMIWYFTPLEWGALGTLYLGLLVLGAAFMAVGLFVSSVTENQIIAALHPSLVEGQVVADHPGGTEALLERRADPAPAQ